MSINIREFTDGLKKLLDETAPPCLQHSVYDIIIGGDFNYNLMRDDERGDVLGGGVSARPGAILSQPSVASSVATDVLHT